MPKNLYTEPMPSPNGTNFERLYIVRKPFAEAMAFDAAMPKYGSGDDDPTDIDLAAPDNEGFDLEDKIRQLLEGKLDDADITMLIKLIQPGEDPAPAPAQDRGKRGRQAHDRRPAMPSRATMERLVAEGAARRAERAIRDRDALVKRYPALASARVA
jgi:hypothetical protein